MITQIGDHFNEWQINAKKNSFDATKKCTENVIRFELLVN